MERLFLISRKFFCIAVIFLAWSHSANAATEKWVTSLSGKQQQPGNAVHPITSDAYTTTVDQWYSYMQANPTGSGSGAWDNIFTVEKAEAIVRLRFDDSDRKRLTGSSSSGAVSWTLDVKYILTTYDASGAATTHGTTLSPEVVSIAYDPFTGYYTDKALRVYPNTHKATLHILSAANNGVVYKEFDHTGTQVGSTLTAPPSYLKDIWLDVEEDVERIYYMDMSTPHVYQFSPLTNTPNSDPAPKNELVISWPYIQGAESYDVEWLFVDIPSDAFSSCTTGMYFANATRVNTPEKHYAISLAYPRGKIIYRIRAVGRDPLSPSTRVEGPWSYDPTPGTAVNTVTANAALVCYSFDYEGLEEKLNWQYSATYVEDGKKAEAISFYDGSLNSRQNVTVNNADNTAAIGETKYDFEGRPAVSVMPSIETNLGLQFYQYYSVGNYYPLNNYDRNSFDLDANVSGGSATMPTTSGAGQYYSSANTGTGNAADYIPDAQGYPFTQERYMNDGTGRIRSQSGLGYDHRLTSGHETEYFYGTPAGQEEIDRLFGNEVGYVSHYKKNMVVDANDQVSITYLDQEGRVIATALAGDAPDNLMALDSENVANTLTINLLGNNHFDQQQDMVSQNALTVSSPGNYDFSYSLNGTTHCSSCMALMYPTEGCVDCMYDLEIMVTNTDGDSIDINGASSGYAYRLNGISQQSPAFTFTVNFSSVGVYTVTKTLRLSKTYQDQYRSNYIDVQTNPENTSSCVTLPTVDPVPCSYGCNTDTPPTCEICTEIYTTGTDGGGDYYIDPNDVTQTHIYGSQRADSIAKCNAVVCGHQVTIPDPCEMKRKQMIADMSPGGQYFDNTPKQYLTDPANPTGAQDPNVNYLSYTDGTGYHSGDINDWLDAHYDLSSFNSDAGTSFATWEDVRDPANWSDAWETYLLPHHPEYCAFQYFCGGVSCEGAISIDHTESDLFAYESSMITAGDLYLNDGTYGTDGLFDPTAISTSTITLTYSSAGVTNDNSHYGPPSSVTPSSDPYFDCVHSICSSPSVSAVDVVNDLLMNYIPVYDASGNPITSGGNQIYYSIWYLLDDPDNIAGGSCTGCSGLDPRIIDMFAALQNQISTTSMTKYMYFRGAYMYFKEMVKAMGYDDYVSANSCPNTTSSPTAYHNGYLVTLPDGPFTPDGFVAYFPENPMYAGMGDGCSPPANTLDVADGVLTGLSSTTIPDHCNAACTAASYDWMTSLGSCIAVADTQNVRSLLIQICTCSCDADNMNGTDACTAGVYDAVSGLTFHSFNDVVTHYGTGCTTPVHPQPDPGTGACTCQNLHEFIDATGLDPTDVTLQDDIVAAFNALFDPAGTYTWPDISGWLTTCEAAAPNADDLTSVPEPIRCVTPTETTTDFTTQATADCEEESNTIAENEANTIYLENLELAANGYVDAYRNSCLNLTGKEEFTVTFSQKEYYYTLYYYDQAGNLIKTVPPEGVHPIYSTTQLTAVQNHRNDPVTYPTPTYPPHTMVTNYKFNSLQQSTEATTPDGGTTTFWYDVHGRIVASQNAKQALYATPGYSYTLYDALGRPYEAGETYSSTAMTYAISRGSFDSWVNTAIAAGATQVVHTYYDEQIPGSGTSDFVTGGQQNLRNRVSSVTYEETRNTAGPSSSNDPLIYDNATHYSYDIHGNASVVVQENNNLHLDDLGQRFKRIDYEYDVASGKVNAVHYQQNTSEITPQTDEFHHKYEYDANNRLTTAYTSRDGYTWDADARYFYYAHGPVARVELGDKTVQGQDYAYTINGWLKGVNSDTRDKDRDMGKDGSTNSSGLNYSFGRDAFGYSLSYFDGDYTPVTTPTLSGNFLASVTNYSSNAFHAGYYELFNGNIAAMTTAITDHNETQLDVQGRNFRYDQLNRIKQVNAFKDATNLVANNYWGAASADNGNYYEDFAYDMNGNILDVRRNGNLGTTHQQMDLLTYNYTTNTNQLSVVTESASSLDADYGNDIDAAGGGAYTYDAIGNLVTDASEQIDNVEWSVTGKIKKITRTATSTKSDLEFIYDAMGNRIVKIVKPRSGSGLLNQEDWTYTYYVRDASGNVMAVYERTFEDKHDGSFDDHFNVKEWDIFGSQRLGLKHPDDVSSNVTKNFTATHTGVEFNLGSISYAFTGGGSSCVSGCLLTRTLGKKEYEEANHLGNVLESVSDMKYAIGTTSSVDYYLPDVISYADYYAFGQTMPGRTGGTKYRYGFNDKENDLETGTQDYGMRIYNPALGRFLSVDPITAKYPELTPYQFASDRPIDGVDLDGLEYWYPRNISNAPLLDKPFDSRNSWVCSPSLVDDSKTNPTPFQVDQGNERINYYWAGGQAGFDDNGQKVDGGVYVAVRSRLIKEEVIIPGTAETPKVDKVDPVFGWIYNTHDVTDPEYFGVNDANNLTSNYVIDFSGLGGIMNRLKMTDATNGPNSTFLDYRLNLIAFSNMPYQKDQPLGVGADEYLNGKYGAKGCFELQGFKVASTTVTGFRLSLCPPGWATTSPPFSTAAYVGTVTYTEQTRRWGIVTPGAPGRPGISGTPSTSTWRDVWRAASY